MVGKIEEERRKPEGKENTNVSASKLSKEPVIRRLIEEKQETQEKQSIDPPVSENIEGIEVDPSQVARDKDVENQVEILRDDYIDMIRKIQEELKQFLEEEERRKHEAEARQSVVSLTEKVKRLCKELNNATTKMKLEAENRDVRDEQRQLSIQKEFRELRATCSDLQIRITQLSAKAKELREMKDLSLIHI